MRLRRMIRSKSHDLREFRKEWIESGLPQYPYNRVIKSYLRELKEKRTWLNVPIARVKVGKGSGSGMWARMKRTILSFLRRPKKSVSVLGATGPGLLLACLIILLSCAASQSLSANCTTTLCGDVCCNNDGELCPVCWEENDGEGVRELRGRPETGVQP